MTIVGRAFILNLRGPLNGRLTASGELTKMTIRSFNIYLKTSVVVGVCSIL